MIERLKNTLLEAIKEKLRGRNLICGICGGTRWQIVGINPLPLRQDLNNSLVVEGPHIPTALSCCERCGNMINFNIIALVGGIDKYNQLVNDCKADAIIEGGRKN